jgi:hypothetical protein
MQGLNKCVRCTTGLLGRCMWHSFRNPSSLSVNLLIYVVTVSYLSQWSVVYSWEQNFDSKSPPVSYGFRHTGHETWTGFLNNPQSIWLSHSEPWTAVRAFRPTLSIGHRAWGVTSQFHTFVTHISSTFQLVINLLVLATQLTAVLHAGSLVIYYSFLNFRLCSIRLSRPDRTLLRFESVICLVDGLYDEGT